MKVNMGSADRLIRVLVAVSVSVLVFFNVLTGVGAIVGLVAAAVLVLTSFVKFCPLYFPFNLHTLTKKDKETGGK